MKLEPNNPRYNRLKAYIERLYEAGQHEDLKKKNKNKFILDILEKQELVEVDIPLIAEILWLDRNRREVFENNKKWLVEDDDDCKYEEAVLRDLGYKETEEMIDVKNAAISQLGGEVVSSTTKLPERPQIAIPNACAGLKEEYLKKCMATYKAVEEVSRKL